jgi:hypothetical protein
MWRPAIWIEVRIVRIQRQANQLVCLAWQDVVGPGLRGHLHAVLCPVGIPLAQLAYGHVPGACFLVGLLRYTNFFHIKFILLSFHWDGGTLVLAVEPKDTLIIWPL